MPVSHTELLQMSYIFVYEGFDLPGSNAGNPMQDTSTVKLVRAPQSSDRVLETRRLCIGGSFFRDVLGAVATRLKGLKAHNARVVMNFLNGYCPRDRMSFEEDLQIANEVSSVWVVDNRHNLGELGFEFTKMLAAKPWFSRIAGLAAQLPFVVAERGIVKPQVVWRKKQATILGDPVPSTLRTGTTSDVVIVNPTAAVLLVMVATVMICLCPSDQISYVRNHIIDLFAFRDLSRVRMEFWLWVCINII